MSRVLITGGAGFIGAHLANSLLSSGYSVRILDNLTPQVHGDEEWPEHLDREAELIVGDIRDPDAAAKALVGTDRVVHLAARVGVGQSMYEISEYVSVNALGTAVLLQALLDHPVERLVVASSMSVYGEGLYRDSAGQPAVAAERSRAQLERGEWEPVSAEGDELVPIPTPETKPPALSSIYALNKYEQERSTLLFGGAYDIPTTALRFFNVYGPYQALSNPYTGVLAIFAARLLNGRPPRIFEDGGQRRDFVSVFDVARACAAALESEDADGEVINIGSGRSVSVAEIAARLGAMLDKEHIVPEVTGQYRVGDIRHCFADVSKAERLLRFRPEVDLDSGIADLAAWLEGRVAVDRVDDATEELRSRGLTL